MSETFDTLQITYLLPSSSFIFSTVTAPRHHPTPSKLFQSYPSKRFSSLVLEATSKLGAERPLPLLPLRQTLWCLHFVGLQWLFAFQVSHEDCSVETDSLSHLFLQSYSMLLAALFAFMRLSALPTPTSVQFLAFCFVLESVSWKVLSEIVCWWH